MTTMYVSSYWPNIDSRVAAKGTRTFLSGIVAFLMKHFAIFGVWLKRAMFASQRVSFLLLTPTLFPGIKLPKILHWVKKSKCSSKSYQTTLICEWLISSLVDILYFIKHLPWTGFSSESEGIAHCYIIPIWVAFGRCTWYHGFLHTAAGIHCEKNCIIKLHVT